MSLLSACQSTQLLSLKIKERENLTRITTAAKSVVYFIHTVIFPSRKLMYVKSRAGYGMKKKRLGARGIETKRKVRQR